jgi:hypothetical protein
LEETAIASGNDLLNVKRANAVPSQLQSRQRSPTAGMPCDSAAIPRGKTLLWPFCPAAPSPPVRWAAARFRCRPLHVFKAEGYSFTSP